MNRRVHYKKIQNRALYTIQGDIKNLKIVTDTNSRIPGHFLYP